MKRHPTAWVMPMGWRRLGWSDESDFPFGDMVSPSPPFPTFDIHHEVIQSRGALVRT